MRAPRAILTAALPLLLTMPAAAQDDFVEFGVGALGSGARGLEAGCGTNTAVGPSFTVGRRIWRGASVQAATHLHLFDAGPLCAETPLPPRPDGTYVDHRAMSLLAAEFVATDLRLRLGAETTEGVGIVLSVGGGAAWRAGNDLPYAVMGTSLHAPLGRLRLVLRGDLYQIRVRFDIVEETWRDLQPVATSVVGTAHEWNSAVRVAIGLLVPLVGKASSSSTRSRDRGR